MVGGQIHFVRYVFVRTSVLFPTPRLLRWKRCTWWLESDSNEIFGRHVNNMHTGTGCKGPGHDRLTNRFLRGRVALPSVRSPPPSTPFSFARTPRKRRKPDIEHDLVFLFSRVLERKKETILSCCLWWPSFFWLLGRLDTQKLRACMRPIYI